MTAMRTRHRIPSVFNLSMVDVLCCALGCVILLWLLNLRDAKQKAAQAGRADEQVVALRRDLDGLRAELADLSGKYAAAEEQVSEAERRASAVRARLETAEAEARTTADLLKKARSARATAEEALARRAKEAGELAKGLAALRSEKTSADEALARRDREIADLDKKQRAAAERAAALAEQLRDRGAEAAGAARRADELAARLKETEARAAALEKEINKRERGLSDADKSLAAAQRRIAALEDEKKGLIADAERVRVAADNRFAGIQLTGRRVVFLVDMSGSMDYVDEKTQAPEKWSGVRDALVKIMRSLPNLEKYQVVLFSDKVTFLFGDEGWLDYDAGSAGRVTEALTRIKPKGGTNMYAAFDAAFRYRRQGLDTVYLLSDGLPNMGEGLTDAQARGMSETQQAEILGKYVRRKLRNDWNREIRGEGRVRVNAVGFFYESPDVGAFLWALTRENDGGFVGMSKP
jgi:predicted  nucleic acid-binding Zn-ribbon protein